jgi:CelD/BcsL family acetyltransferase involved in cellulose biosynthesis
VTHNDVRDVGVPRLDTWKELIRQDPTALIFQTPEWLRCLTRCGWTDASRMYETRDGRLLVLPLVGRRHRPSRASVLASLPPGWGTGGIVASGGVRPDEVAAVAAQLVSEGFLQVRLRPSFLAGPAWELAALPLGKPIRRQVHVLDLRGGMDQVWNNRFRSKARQGMRAALRRADESGVTVHCGTTPDLVSQFYELYLKWAAYRARARGIPPWLAQVRARHAEPRRIFEVVASEMGDRCRIRVASLQDRPVAATVTLRGDFTAIYWRGYDDRERAQAYHLPEMLQLAAIKEACGWDCHDYEMGESGGIASLERFKQKLGGQPRPVAEYRLERLPLSELQDSTASAFHRLESYVVDRSVRRSASGSA